VNILKSLDEADERLNASLPQQQQYTSYSPPPSSSSSTSATNATMSTSLNECFELFTQTEELSDENSWKCSKCKQQTNAYKNLCVSKAPPILIIHLKRFFYKSKTSNFKLTTPVWFPVTGLDIGKYVAAGTRNDMDSVDNLIGGHRGSNGFGESSSSDNKYVYDLFAVCNHKGQNMANGHYTGMIYFFFVNNLKSCSFCGQLLSVKTTSCPSA
jgi:ubiquitin carboxyl-terminal hydrolase 8